MQPHTVLKYLCTTRTLELNWNYLRTGRFGHLVIGTNIIVILSCLMGRYVLETAPLSSPTEQVNYNFDSLFSERYDKMT